MVSTSFFHCFDLKPVPEFGTLIDGRTPRPRCGFHTSVPIPSHRTEGRSNVGDKAPKDKAKQKKIDDKKKTASAKSHSPVDKPTKK